MTKMINMTDKELHKDLKITCALAGITMAEFTYATLREAVNQLKEKLKIQNENNQPPNPEEIVQAEQIQTEQQTYPEQSQTTGL